MRRRRCGCTFFPLQRLVADGHFTKRDLAGSSRRVIPITGGTFKGKISGEVLNLGFDALLLSADMTAR